MDGSNASLGVGRVRSRDASGAVETARRCQAWIEGRAAFLGLDAV